MNQSETARARRGFTLTELLIVIAIIGVLAALVTGAAIRAMNTARRARIVLEIKNISGSLESFKSEFGAYPPNAMNNGTTVMIERLSSDFERMAKKAFPRINPQELSVFRALAGDATAPSAVNQPLQNGLTAAEALFFWLGGFSSDPQYPLSGPGGPSFVDDVNGEVLEERTFRYEFNLGRLGPRTDGELDPTAVRFIEYTITINGKQQERRINLWNYRPDGSEQPLVYFDCSRYKPAQYDMWAINPDWDGAPPLIFAFKALRTGAKQVTNANSVFFVNQKTFQILHCGLDDAWGDFSFVGEAPAVQNVANAEQMLKFPEGPFLGEIEDTLTNFTDGTIAAAAEE